MAIDRPAICRITKRRDFLAVAGKGNKVVASTLVLQGYFPFRDGDGVSSAPFSAPLPIRVGFTVTKKVGNAVVRNRIRRRLRAAAQQVLPEAGLPGWEYVIIGRGRAESEPFDIILRDLRYAVRKAAKLEAERRTGSAAGDKA